MSRSGRFSVAACLAALGLLTPLASSPARGQFRPAAIELSSAVTLDEADSSVRAHLERVKAYVADHQWDEAVETLRQLMEDHAAKMIALVPGRYVNLARYCQVQIASLPDETLALYRQRVDPLAQMVRRGARRRDPTRLAKLLDTMFASTSGDDALWALGEIELERGHFGAARGYWEQLIESPPARVPADRFEAARGQQGLSPDDARLLDTWYALDPAAKPRAYELHGEGVVSDEVAERLVRFWKHQQLPSTRLAYPGSDLPKSAIRARLVLASIMEGSLAPREASYGHSKNFIPEPRGGWPDAK